MRELLLLFVNNLLPIFLAAGAGFLVAKYLGVPAKPVSRIAFFIFSPCLIFTLLTSGRLNGDDITLMVAYAAVSIILVGLVTGLIAYILRFKRTIIVALLITVMFGNVGNFGLSLNLFAFGEDALAFASIYFVTSATLVYTLGVVLASWGKTDLKTALVGVLKVPVIYAVLLALLFNWQKWELPLPIDRTVSLFSDAAIPVMIVLLGIQLYNAKVSKEIFTVGLSNVLRLVVSPALAIGLAAVFHLEGSAYQAGVLEAAVPTAVLATVLATEYNLEPSLITTAVVSSTLLSPLTVTPLLKILGA
ncbi:MAG: AEC family transporter [Chloroflexota bacterium]|nr:MAG: AEC family transporter [Chloroflexota bacterium]